MTGDRETLAAAAPVSEDAGFLDGVVAECLQEMRIKPRDDGYDLAQRGVQFFIASMLEPQRAGERVDKSALGAMIAEIDARLTAQVNEILHHAEFQKLEAAWRSLKYMVDKFDFRANVKLEVLNVTKDQLLQDFEDSPDVTTSGFYRQLYSNEYGVHGGKPYGMVASSFEITAAPADLDLLSRCASVSAMAHAPFIANVSSSFFGEESFESLSALPDLHGILEGPQYARWRSFRQSEDARYVGLCMPKFLLRLPYGPETTKASTFNFSEDVVGHHDRYCWGPSSATFAARVADSFAKYAWCPNIIGPQGGGAVEGLPLHQYKRMGEIQTKEPTEISLTDRRELELSEEGFIPLVWRKGNDNAAFFSAASAHLPAKKQNKDEQTNLKLGAMLPYTFIITRLAHYLKVMQRESIGKNLDASALQRELNDWIKHYVSDMPNPDRRIIAERPLKRASVSVEPVPGEAGWFRCGITVVPHIKYGGADFTLSLVGKLDEKK